MSAEALENLVHTPWAKALGWTLFHSLWEGAVVAIVLAAALFAMRSARGRYAAACLAMLAILAGFVVTFALVMPKSGASPTKIARSIPPAPIGDYRDVTRATEGIDPSDILPWLAPFWIAGVIIFHLRGLAGWIAARRLRNQGVCRAPNIWVERLRRLQETLRLSKPVALMETCLGEVPVVVGWLRPAILVPVGMLAGMPAGQIEAILMHELAHIRRHDYLVNLLQTVVEGFLFYHPAIWWISSVARAERENCCDDLVVAASGNAPEYAAALTALEHNRQAASEAALAATGGHLMKRVRRLLYPLENPRAVLTPVVSAGILTVTAALALVAWQSTPSPQPQPQPELQLAPLPLTSTPAATVSATYIRDIVNDDVVYVITDAERAAFQKLLIDNERKRLVQQLAQNFQSAPLRQSLETPWDKWLNEDVAYIITDEERKAFKSLQTDDERKEFIEQFWLRRDPTPGTVENEFKTEHYRRIAYANAHFGSESSVPGWKTDRGRIYIVFGPPDEIDAHPSGGAYQRPAAEGGGQTTTAPFQDWRYSYIQGIGNDVTIEFVDKDGNGEYHMTKDPSEKDAVRYVRPQ